jgi:hypothetical protein
MLDEFASHPTSRPGQLARSGPIKVAGQSKEEQHGDEESQSRPKTIGLREVFLSVSVGHVAIQTEAADPSKNDLVTGRHD